MVALTIGMVTDNDFDGVYFALQALRLYHDLDDTELLVVDNHGCKHTKKFVEGSAKGRYVLAPEAVGTAAARDRIFREAAGEAVLCCDAHVIFAPGAIARLRAYFRDHPGTIDLLHGPSLHDGPHDDPDEEPFETPMPGPGAFSCRKDAWPGLNPRFRGFEGQEGYLLEKVRRAGGRSLCLPWLRWSHRPGRSVPRSAADELHDRVIGHAELGLDIAPVLAHFRERLPDETVTAVVVEALWGRAAAEPTVSPAAGGDDPAVLAGVRPIDAVGLADLAFARARLGAAWLSAVVRPDGAFPYVYYPTNDTYDTDRYNEVRHAGTTYSLFQSLEVFGDEPVRVAAEAAARYIAASSPPVAVGGRAYAYGGLTKLGGQALALVALLERRRVLGDTALDAVIGDLAAFLLGMELTEEPGRYHQSYDLGTNQRLLTPDSDYYPGEALLALTRLAQQFPDGPYLAAAVRAAAYLIRTRDGDIVARGQVPREDHWLAIALSDLYRLDPRPDYATVAYLQAEAMLANQHPTDDPDPRRIGAARRPGEINYTSTATKGEAMVAVWGLAAARQDPVAVERFATGARRTIQFLMRVQYTAENTRHFPRPDRVVGGWGQDAVDPRIRLDFVQHNISALIGVWRLTGDDHPPTRLDGATRHALTIRQRQVLSGPNIWAPLSVIRLRVAVGELGEGPSDQVPGFEDRLTAALPSLLDHPGGRDGAGSFAARLRERDWVGHVLADVALALQKSTGGDVSWGTTRATAERGVYDVVYQFQHEEVGLAAGELAARLLDHLIYGTAPLSEPEFDLVHERQERVVKVAERFAYGPSSTAIVAEAERRGIPVLRLHPDRPLFQLGHGAFQRRIWSSFTSQTPTIAVNIAGNKEQTNYLLRAVGIPVPSGGAVHSADEAVRTAELIGYPVVLKPVDGNQGRGVCIDLGTEAQVRESFPVALGVTGTGTVVVERFVPGKDYRILVVDGRIVAVAERVPAHVVGDGTHTVQELVDLTNADPRRGPGFKRMLTLIAVDALTVAVLTRQDLTLDDIPAAGRIVPLKLTSNLSTGGSSIDRTDEIHPDNAAIICQAALAVGLDVAGVDFRCPDIGQSAREFGGAIIEVNARPGLRVHTQPNEGRPRRVGRAVVEMLFPPGRPVRVPIVAVAGAAGATATCRLIAHLMETAGRVVGLGTADGISVAGARITVDDAVGPTGVRMVLKNPAIDYAVLETPSAGILRSGLGFDHCDVAVITGLAGDHLELGGVDTAGDLARLAAVVPASVRRDGATILNADDQRTSELARTARGEIVFFSVGDANPVVRDHVRARGRAVILRQTRAGATIALVEAGRETSVLPVNQLPAGASGSGRIEIADVLAATAVAVAQDVPMESIRLALRSLTAGDERQPSIAVAPEHAEVAESIAYDSTAAAIVAAAEQRGIPVRRLFPDRPFFQLGHGAYQRRIWGTLTSETATTAVKIAGNKEHMRHLLRAVGIPAPSGAAARTADEAVWVAADLGYPVVLKPIDGRNGRGVCLDLGTEAQVREAFPVAHGVTGTGVVVVERFVPGKHHRILVVNNQIVAVDERVPAHVLGDGMHTVRQLVELANADVRGAADESPPRLALDAPALDALARQGLAPDDVPATDRFVQLMPTSNRSSGGASIDRTDEIHPDNAEIARQAAMVVGFDVAGVDLVTPDISRSIHTAGGAIIEVNPRPQGRRRQVGRAVIEMLFPPGRPVRVPIVAVAGAAGATATCRLIAHLMGTVGRTVGLDFADGIFVAGARILAPDASGGTTGVRLVLTHPTVDYAVLEIGYGGGSPSDLGFDRCDIAVITDVVADDIDSGGVDAPAARAWIEAVVAGADPGGVRVLNADDPRSAELAGGNRGRTVFFSRERDNPVVTAHLRERGRGVVLRQTGAGEMITLVEDLRATSLLAVDQIPATVAGRGRVEIGSILAAVATGLAQDLPVDQMRDALRTFGGADL